LRSLSPGTYQVKVSCTMKDGNWIPEQEILVLTILPPWYRTWWFFLICILLIVAGIFQAFRYALKRKDNKMKWAMKEREQQAYEDKVRFLINISHELRTPLTLIHAPLSRILHSMPTTDTYYHPLTNIFRQSQRMKNLINMVLDVRKMEVGESKIHLVPIDLSHWLTEISQDFSGECEARKVRLLLQFDTTIDKISVDKEKCDIILSNLLINAIKHSPENTAITLSTSVVNDRKFVRISVSDEGIGLKDVDPDKLFSRFYQGENEKIGSGIGLSYSKILIEQQDGHIGAADRPEGGATFFIELPIRQDAAEIAVPPKPYINELIGADQSDRETEPILFNTSESTLLFVDDNTDLVQFIKDSLGSLFKRIFVAYNGEEALQIARSHMPDIIVSDVMMPKMNGYQLCKTIKEDVNISHIPVILLTAKDDRQSQLNGYKNGADAYLTKPFEIEMLIELIKNRIRDRQAMRQRYMGTGLLPAPEESTFSSADENFLIKLNRIMTENLENTTFDILQLSREIGMSRASLYNKLKVLTDMSTGEYINKFRMEKAIALIKTTSLSFTEISEKVGYATSRYFSTAFKQYTGETPTQYKEKIR
jgi:signal transduction histidine kinase/DNA-binding response OmpR family regulator